jgi:hypothetical protein
MERVMSDYSRADLERALMDLVSAGQRREIFKELDRPEFVPKTGQAYAYQDKHTAAWRIWMWQDNFEIAEGVKYRRPNPQELGLAMKFVKCVHADIKAETRYWEGYDRAIDHCNKLMGWDSDE